VDARSAANKKVAFFMVFTSTVFSLLLAKIQNKK